MSARRVALGLAMALALCAGSARAQDTAEARAAFQQGVRMLEDARYAEAVSALERSLAIREVPPVLYNLALAYRGTGAYLRAIASFERFLAVAAPREALRGDAATIVAELRRSLARVHLVVRGASTDVRVDDRPVSPGDLDDTLPMDPGRHVIEARRAGYRPAQRMVNLAPGATEEVALDAAEAPLPSTLQVEANVPEASIVLDGRERGRGTFEGELPAGTHALEVSAASHSTERRDLELAPGRRERVVITLAQRPSVLTRWWFWTGAAVVVAGLVVGGVLLFSGTADPVQGTWGTAYGAVTSW